MQEVVFISGNIDNLDGKDKDQGWKCGSSLSIAHHEKA